MCSLARIGLQLIIAGKFIRWALGMLVLWTQSLSTVYSQKWSTLAPEAHQNSPTEVGSHFSLAGIPGMDSSIPVKVPVAPAKWLGE